MTFLDLLATIPAGVHNLTTGPTLSAGLWTALLVALPLLLVAVLTPTSRGPLHVCACGHRDRLRGDELRRVFERRFSEHLDACPAIGRQP